MVMLGEDISFDYGLDEPSISDQQLFRIDNLMVLSACFIVKGKKYICKRCSIQATTRVVLVKESRPEQFGSRKRWM